MASSLLLNLTVNKLLPAPQNASVGIGFFRVPCPLTVGNIISDQTFTVATGVTVVRDQPCSTLVLRTDQPVTVTMVSASATITLVVDQLLAVTTELTSVSVTYQQPVGSTVAQASVSLIQS